FLDQRGPGDAIFGEQRCAIVARRVRGTASLGEIDGTGAAKRACRWLDLARRNGLERGLAQETRDRAAHADDLGLLAGGRIAVAGRVNGFEAGFNSAAFPGR